MERLTKLDRMRFAQWLGSELEVSLQMAGDQHISGHAATAREAQLELAVALRTVSKHLRAVVPGTD